jgi:hypothetical protein
LFYDHYIEGNTSKYNRKVKAGLLGLNSEISSVVAMPEGHVLLESSITSTINDPFVRYN